ncbi:DDE-domain-containing protein [Didymella exigua CBS 183.55]|uniref:DDE-domain-containing protein n=1 Tax=Didymella exigua CBS 183.55 TaxID=1150837 RepID=A0A6A5R2K2_9PLEO|nr:DDE-domain-containing protein [Didymella exigua CBS 183.55]KAF1922285.1 DDE-domain-containing protein [Didymella exigua CBS 183.55]
MDASRHNADDSEKYSYYFNLLRSKIDQYSIKPRHTYNMDEKGLAIGLVNRSKRVFSKAAWEAGGKRQSLQDGNREWVTILAAICADGSTLPPAIIYAGQPNSLQSSWMEDLDAGKDSIYSTATPSGWSNDEVGLAWLEQVFERETASKTRGSWRLLILDGHSSHITMAFINFCSCHKILLLIYPPHSTQTLQPLDVGCFSPFGNNYSKELVLAAFKATGILLLNLAIILDRFQNKLSELPRTPSPLLNVNRVAIEQFCKAIVKDSTSYETRKLVRTFNYLAARNALLEKTSQRYHQALLLQASKSYTSNAMLWSPTKVDKAQAQLRQNTRQQAEEAAAKARKKAEAAEKKVQDEREKEQRKVERARAKEEKALRKAAEKAEKQQKKQESDAAKSIQLSQTGKRKASQKPPTEPPAKKQRARGATQVVVEASPSPTPPPITTRSGRTTRLNRK